jgi:uncharacterized protein (TIGR02147 family)
MILSLGENTPMKVFAFNDYRKCVRALIDRKQELFPNFTLTKMAHDMAIQPSYLTNVLNGRAHFSTDQTFKVGTIFDLSVDEHEYLMLLVEHSKTGIADRKRELSAKIEILKKKHLTADRILKSAQVGKTPFDESRYYLDPFVSIIHQYLGTKNSSFDKIFLAQKFGLSTSHVDEIIKTLLELLLIRKQKNNRWEVAALQTHLSKNSPLTRPHHAQLRQLSIDRLQRLGSENFYSYSVILTATDEERARIQSEFLSFIKIVEDLVTPAESESVFQMNFDLFPW